jgi:hypothetical protein
MKKYYKYVQRTPDGKLISTFTNHSRNHMGKLSGIDCNILEYKPNRIMSAAGAGVFLLDTLYMDEDTAGQQSSSQHRTNCFGLGVYEAMPLAEVRIHRDYVGYGHPTCKVVRIGKLIKRYV